jgi:hypothetical protein
LEQLRHPQLRFFEGRIGVKHIAPDELPGKDEMRLALNLFPLLSG